MKRGSSMTPRMRVLCAMKREGKPDRVPFEISWGAFTPRLMRIYHEKTGSPLAPDDYFDFDTRYVRPDPGNKIIARGKYFPGGIPDSDVSFDEWGIGTVPTEYEIPDYKYHPLATCRTVSEIEGYEWPDLDAGYRYTIMEQRTKEIQEKGYAVCGDLYQTIFETAWLMRGMEDFLSDLYLNPAVAHAICECITSIRVKQAARMAHAGIDILRLGDDVVTQQGLMMSHDAYRSFFKNRIKRIIAAARRENPDILVFMHSCGRVEDMIEEFMDEGVDVINPVQPECNDLSMIVQRYGGKISFWGGIGVQSVMPHGTPEDVLRAMRETMVILGSGGGWLAAPAHILDPAIPWENIVAFVDSARSLYYK